MWVYWGKLGHLKTSSQEGAVLEPQLQGTQRGEAGGAGRGSKVRENVLWPLLLALGRHRPHLSPGGWATALNSLALSKLPEPGSSLQCVSLVCLGLGPREGTLHWESGFEVPAQPLSLEHAPHSLVPLLCHPSDG